MGPGHLRVITASGGGGATGEGGVGGGSRWRSTINLDPAPWFLFIQIPRVYWVAYPPRLLQGAGGGWTSLVLAQNVAVTVSCCFRSCHIH